MASSRVERLYRAVLSVLMVVVVAACGSDHQDSGTSVLQCQGSCSVTTGGASSATSSTSSHTGGKSATETTVSTTGGNDAGLSTQPNVAGTSGVLATGGSSAVQSSATTTASTGGKSSVIVTTGGAASTGGSNATGGKSTISETGGNPGTGGSSAIVPVTGGSASTGGSSAVQVCVPAALPAVDESAPSKPLTISAFTRDTGLDDLNATRGEDSFFVSHDISCFNLSDCYIAAYSRLENPGHVIHQLNGVYTVENTPAAAQINAVKVAPDGTVIAGGSRFAELHTLLTFKAPASNDWQTVDSSKLGPAQDGQVKSIWVSPTNIVYAVVMVNTSAQWNTVFMRITTNELRNNEAWEVIPTPQYNARIYVSGVWGDKVGNVFINGTVVDADANAVAGLLWRYNNCTVVDLSSTLPSDIVYVNDIHANAQNEYYIGGMSRTLVGALLKMNGLSLTSRYDLENKTATRVFSPWAGSAVAFGGKDVPCETGTVWCGDMTVVSELTQGKRSPLDAEVNFVPAYWVDPISGTIMISAYGNPEAGIYRASYR